MTQAVDIPLLPAQREFMKAAIDGKAPHVCYRGGLGSGKTFVGVGAIIVLALMFAGTSWVYCAKTYPQLRDAVLPEFRSMMDGKFPHVDYGWSKTDKTAYLPNGARILFRSADASESLKSTNPDGILFEEVTDWSEDDFNRVYARARSTGAGMPRRLLVYNPRPGWLQDRVDAWVNAGIGIQIVAPTTENIYLPDSYASNLIETYGGPDSALVRRMVMGESVAFDGLVYPAFNKATHVLPASEFKFDSVLERFAGIDFGYMTGHAFVYLMLAKKGEDWFVIAEHVKEMTLLADHAAAIKAIEARFPATGNEGIRRLADHDAQDRAELAKLGIATIPANKDVMPGITKVSGLLAVKGNGRPNLYVLDSCPKTIDEFGKYEWDTGSRNERPRKDFDHCMDALRYVIASHRDGASGRFHAGSGGQFVGRSTGGFVI